MIALLRMVAIRSISARRLRALLSTFGIVLGVAGMYAINATNQAAYQSITTLFQGTSGRVNLEVRAADLSSRFPEEALRRVEGWAGVGAAAPVIRLQAALVDEAGAPEMGLSFFGASAGGLLLNGIDPEKDLAVRDYTLTAGRFLSPNGGDFEVVLVDTFAEKNEIAIGERILVQTTEGIEKLRVVGLMAMEGPGQQNQGSFGVVSLETAQKLTWAPGEIDQVDVLVAVGSSDPEALDEARLSLQERLGKSYAVTFPASQGERMGQMLSSYQIGLNFMGGIALFVGAFLIYNAFSMTVLERSREFGLLRCIGLTREQVIGQVLFEGLVLGVIGSALGGLFGIALSRGLVVFMGQILGQELDAGAIPWGLLAACMALGLGVTLAAALLPAVQAGQISPLEALRLRGQKPSAWLNRWGFWTGLALLGVSAALLFWNPFPYDVQFRLGSIVTFGLFLGAMLLVPATTGVWERLARAPFQALYGSGGQLGARNLERSQLRTMLTAAALLVGVSMIVVVQGMTASFSSDLLEWMEAYIGGDLFVNASVPLKRDMQDRLERVPGVSAASPIRYFNATWVRPDGEEESLNFMAVDPAAHTRVTRFVFSDKATDSAAAVRALEGGGAVLISSVIAEKWNLGPGDGIVLKTRLGNRTFQVAAVVMDFYNQGMVITGSWDDMRRFFRIDDANTIFVKVDPGVSVSGTKDAIDKLYGRRYQLAIESNQSVKSRALALIDQAFSMFDVLGVIAVMVAALGVVNTMTMSVIERTREIGMLRSIGMTRAQIVKMILAEAGLLGLIGGLMGLVFGILLTQIFLTSMTAMSGYALEMIITTRSVLAAVIVSLVVSQLAAVLPAARAARTPVLEAIHYE